ncbi:hypothetical protein Cni_G13020 [Canna indica]|uniref:E2F/DP family winged-helix DNA-binding domain-containing protein n=1 Tax=Canna indica TaxID=4628 RepID=A0AAQ3K972_9LILI|nr:hypothetical protein Cni_G13020 [Canna indica]
MSGAQDYVNLSRPPHLRGSHIARPPLASSSATAAVANRHFPNPPPVLDRAHLFLGRSPSGGAENDKIPPPNTPNKNEIYGTEKQEIQSIDAATYLGNKEENFGGTMPTGSKIGVKRQRKAKSKNKHIVPLPPGSTDGSNSSLLASNSCRYDSSLGLLTKKFIDLLQKAKDGSLDLNSAAETLEVQKRRIYDITNVLEGVGLIEKTFKNKIRWKGIDMSRPKELDDQIAQLKAEAEALHSEDRRLDQMIREMQENLTVFTENVENRKSLYLTKEDIINIPSFQDATLIAIKAPHGTSLEVPDPDEGADFPQRRYQIRLRSSIGPIDCYLISNHAESIEATNQTPQPTATEMCIQRGCINDDRSLRPSEECSDRGAEHESQVPHEILSNSIISQHCADGIMKIVPSDTDMDADYWLLSDLGVSLTDAWNSECILDQNTNHSCIFISNELTVT